jgi:hypothetical protein
VTSAPILLKTLLQERHWQTYRTFCSEYDKAARNIDPTLIGSWPSRAQLHRWLSGTLKGLPYSDHCRILEVMFPGYAAQEMFSPLSDGRQPSEESEAAAVFATVARGLAAPESQAADWDMAASLTNTATPPDDTDMPLPMTAHSSQADPFTRELGQKLLELQKVLRLTGDEGRLLAGLAGNVVELSVNLDMDIDKTGEAHLTYRHEILNLTNKSITRLPRELWFVYTTGPLVIEPVCEGKRRVAIQRVHDTPTLAKFACQISPAIQPGETGVVGYECRGGQFRELLYWRQSLQRYTRHFTIRLRHRGAGTLTSCSAVEEHPDGSESFALEDLIWDYDGDDIVMTVTRDYLRPNQCVTLRWDVHRAAS